MKQKMTLLAGVLLILVLPTVAGAKPSPDRGDRRAAKAECTTLRGQTDATREAFGTKFRTFGACVRSHAADEAQEEQSAHRNAARDCRDERAEDRAAFVEEYGTNHNKRNAFGKCVSQKAKAKEHEADAEDRQEATEFKDAANDCGAERSADAATFATTYGTDDDAFGQCVSRKARENHEQDETETETETAS